MITEKDLQEAIAECQGQRNPNANTAIKLAAFLTIQREMFGQPETGYSYADSPETLQMPRGDMIGSYGESDFLKAVSGKNPADVWAVMDELMDTLASVNHRVYDGVMRKIQ